MAVTRVQEKTITGSGGAYTSSVTAGNFLVYLAPWSTSVGTVSDNLNGSWALFKTFAGRSSTIWAIFYKIATASGTTTVTPAGGGGAFNGYIFEYTGFSSPPALLSSDYSSATATGTALNSGSFNASQSAELCMAVLDTATGNGLTANPASPFGTLVDGSSSFATPFDSIGSVPGGVTAGTSVALTATLTASQTWFAAAWGIGVTGPLVGQPTPTIGGTENLSGGGNAMEWHVFTAYASGTATALNVYIDTLTTATTIFLGLYNNTTGALLASGSVTIATGLNTISISNTAITYGQQYALAWQSSNTVNVKIVDDGTNNMCFFGTNTAGSMPATLPIPQSPTNLGVPSIYVSGIIGAGAQGTPLGGPSRTQWHWRSSGGTS